jgi:hypothetical protein
VEALTQLLRIKFVASGKILSMMKEMLDLLDLLDFSTSQATAASSPLASCKATKL